MMRPFNAEELQQLEADRTNVRILWERFKHEHQNSTTAPLHAPPILVETSYELLNNTQNMNLSNTPPNVLSGIASIATAMFEFGQFCHRSGYYTGNMQQCICCIVEDADLQQLFGGA